MRSEYYTEELFLEHQKATDFMFDIWTFPKANVSFLNSTNSAVLLESYRTKFYLFFF